MPTAASASSNPPTGVEAGVACPAAVSGVYEGISSGGSAVGFGGSTVAGPGVGVVSDEFDSTMTNDDLTCSTLPELSAAR